MTVPWRWLAALGVMLALGAFIWNREHRLRTSAEQGAEAAQLALKNQIVETGETRRQLRATADQLLGQNAELRAAVAEARAAAPGAAPISASRLNTGPLAVHESFVVHGDLPATPGGLPPPVETPQKPPSEPLPAAGKPCLLHEGDTASISVDVLELQALQGTTIVVGTAELFREDPQPRARIAGGRFQSHLSRSGEVVQPAPASGWGVGMGVACGPKGCTGGPALAFPAASFWGIRAEVTAAILTGDLTQGVITGVVRW